MTGRIENKAYLGAVRQVQELKIWNNDRIGQEGIGQMDYVNAFWVGGLVCALVQILMEKTKMLPGRIMVLLVCTGAVLGALRCEVARQSELADNNKFNFLWVTEFPQLEWSDEEERFVAMHHPFTMPMEEDWHLIDTDPGAVRAKAYDIVLNGTELGGGSVRIHQNDIQSKMFEVLGFTQEQAQEQFGFLLNAFKYGVPPHAGLAYGFDRLAMLMSGCDNIREVIAFPKVKDASCLMCEAPAAVDGKQLEELGIEVSEGSFVPGE